MSAFTRFLLIAVLASLSVALFVGGPKPDSARSLQRFWDLGHIVYFALIPVVLFRAYRISGKFGFQVALTLALAVLGGALIELVQTLFQRSADMGDVARDAIGAMAGLFFLMPERRSVSKIFLRLLQAATLVLIAIQVLPVLVALADEAAARRRFPVLADFETPFETGRWSGNAAFAIDRRVRRNGEASLRVELNTSKYSGVFLDYFPEDWREFRTLQFSIFNASPQELSIICRIHDRAHTQGVQHFEDRFNRAFSLPPGWATVAVDLAEVASAPAQRRMDMGHVRGLGLFAIELPEPRVVHIDDVRLVP